VGPANKLSGEGMTSCVYKLAALVAISPPSKHRRNLNYESMVLGASVDKPLCSQPGCTQLQKNADAEAVMPASASSQPDSGH